MLWKKHGPSNHKSLINQKINFRSTKANKDQKNNLFMNKENTKYIGIDIGGAHLKCVGIDEFKKISYTKYESYQI